MDDHEKLRGAVLAALEPYGWRRYEVPSSWRVGDPPVAMKEYQTAVGLRDAFVWLGDRLRSGNLCVYGQYNGGVDALGELWWPASAFCDDDNPAVFAALADALVGETYAVSLWRSGRADAPALIQGDQLRVARSRLCAAQAAVYDAAHARPRMRD